MILTNKLLLRAGIIAGPLWVVITYAQGLTREGFDMVSHPASLLSQGDLGWLQVTAFVFAGILYIASAVGLRRALNGIGRVWAPITLGIFGIGMVMGGVFRADPALGFPPGTPLGVPTVTSLSSQIHGIAPMIAFTALTVCFFILARRFFKQGKAMLAWSSIVVGIGALVLSALPGATGDMVNGVFNFIPLWIGATVGFLWVSVVLKQVEKELKTV